MRMRNSLVAFAIVLSGLCVTRQAHSADQLYLPRFAKLSDEQRNMLRECLAAHDKLSKLYATYKSAGIRTIRTFPKQDNSRPFSYLCRNDGYALYRVLDGNGQVNDQPRGILVRPEGFLQTGLKGNATSPAVIGFGADHHDGFVQLSALRFPIGPVAIEVWPTRTWFTSESLVPNAPPSAAIATDFTVEKTDELLGTVVTLTLTHPTTHYRKIVFLRDHLWAVKRSELTQSHANGQNSRQVTTFEYDLSTPAQPRMTRFTYATFDLGDPQVGLHPTTDEARRFEDFRFETFEFVPPDLKEFEPSALGLSNITATPPKPDAWLWILGPFVGGVVLVVLALIIRRRMTK